MNKFRRSKNFKYILSLMAMILLLTGCSSNENNQKQKVKVGFFPNITHSQALIGKTQGQFAKSLGEKVDLQWQQFNAGSAEIEAMLAGSVDIGYIGPGPAINGYLKSEGEVQIIAGATDGGAIFVSRRDLHIKNLQDLAGKKIAVPQFGNTQDLTLRKVLAEAGLKDTTKGGTVEILQAENPDIKTYLDLGYIDAAFVPEPWGARLIKEVQANLILDYDQVMRQGKYATAVIIVRKEFAEQHPEIVKNFLKTHVELTKSINDDLPQAKQTVNRQIKELTRKKLADDVLDNAFKRLIITYDPEVASIDEFIDVLKATGYLKKEPDTSNLINLELLNEVLREKGLPEVK